MRAAAATSGSRGGTKMVTTPIFYVNGPPHLGHAFTAVVADAVTRWANVRAGEETTVLVSGTDEHGLKVHQAAEVAGKAPLALCDEVAAQFSSMVGEIGAEAADFVRTTEARHIAEVHNVWRALDDAGLIYSGAYEGWYSVPDEAFVPLSSCVFSDGEELPRAADSGHVLEYVREPNYMLSLGALLPRVAAHLAATPDWVVPSNQAAALQRMLASGELPDLAISRPAQRVKWGIEVPGDPSQLIYVWLDALTNYLTLARRPQADTGRQRAWPPAVQVIGKDILKFHGVYWPAMLLALDEALPDQLLVHSHWTVDSTKMSKSLGNVVTPSDLVGAAGSVDAARYFLLTENNLVDDGNYSHTQLAQRVAELADTFANVLLRTTSKALNPGHELAPPGLPAATFAGAAPECAALLRALDAVPTAAADAFDSHGFARGISEIMDLLRAANKATQALEPWVLVKSANEQDRALASDLVTYVLASVETAALLLQPVMPGATATILDYLGVPTSSRAVSDELLAAPVAAALDRTAMPRPLGDPSLSRKANAQRLRLFTKLPR
ncbi:methionyl-tRNA synthetase [Thecamonas trahens ATCC 50062]|uniref:methionine--tRNA ligase n=1 Tax=Thecamonas trahens ATCC 50062 TaxID=461836 RepID=A0A0L0DPH7_THETB|nr:methionyl-tRNA synthetase [Thecamonas trahens ATCC 50062]KNC54202.1 methionyl-tRNA synthetase [Thecamonas trahens ATCC 50062]|eukprot:XP_013753842.1 methionyl-tRNA synthetase [Thecamonas trahens ATCC 50062]